MSGYTMVREVARKLGWQETAEVRGTDTWVTFTRQDDGIVFKADVRLGTNISRNSVMEANLYENGRLVDSINGGSRVDQLRDYFQCP